MAGYRDDREALRARIQSLEAELWSSRPDRERILAQLDELAGEVGRMGERLESDRADLSTVAEQLGALRREVSGDPEHGSASQSAEAGPQAETRGRPLAWLGCVGLVTLGMLGLFVTSREERKVEPEVLRDPTLVVPASRLEGGPASVDPMAVLAEVHGLAGEAGLVSMELSYVKSDGTVDLTSRSYRASMEIRLAAREPAAPAHPDAPIGAPRPRPTSRSVIYRLKPDGLHVDALTTMNIPLPLPVGRPVGDPHCTPREIWRAAIRAGAPEGAVARMQYGGTLTLLHEDGRPTWRFRIDGTDFEVTVSDADCEVVRNPMAPIVDPAGATSP